jgi:hypothetical protein
MPDGPAAEGEAQGAPGVGAGSSGDNWAPVASQSEVTFGRGRSEWPPPEAQAQGSGELQPSGDERAWPGADRTVDRSELGMIPSRTDDEVSAGDMAWGEPVWSDAVPADPPPPAVDWRKSIPREFVARTSPSGRPAHEPVRPEPTPPGAPMANGRTYPPVPPVPPPPGPSTGPGAKPTWPGEAEDDASPPAGSRAVGSRHDEPSRANGVNGVSHGAHTREPSTRDAPSGSGASPSTSEHDDDLTPGSEDTGVWNQLDREIARALATALAGKLAQYVTGPILPLVADELARMVGSSASPGESGEGEGNTGERKARHFGDGAPRR